MYRDRLLVKSRVFAGLSKRALHVPNTAQNTHGKNRVMGLFVSVFSPNLEKCFFTEKCLALPQLLTLYIVRRIRT